MINLIYYNEFKYFFIIQLKIFSMFNISKTVYLYLSLSKHFFITEHFYTL